MYYFLLLCNKLPQIQQLKTIHTYSSHSFHGSKVQEWFSWVLWFRVPPDCYQEVGWTSFSLHQWKWWRKIPLVSVCREMLFHWIWVWCSYEFSFKKCLYYLVFSKEIEYVYERRCIIGTGSHGYGCWQVLQYDVHKYRTITANSVIQFKSIDLRIGGRMV